MTKEKRQKRKKRQLFDFYAIWSYEQLIISQPHIDFLGLWIASQQYYILCPDATNLVTIDGDNLIAWFNSRCRIATAAVEIVCTLPAEAHKVRPTTAKERAVLKGAPRNIRDLYTDISLRIDIKFPNFSLKYFNNEIAVVTRSKLTDLEKKLFMNVFRGLTNLADPIFLVDPLLDVTRVSFRSTTRDPDIDLIPSRNLPSSYGQDVKRLAEEDDDFWSSIQVSLNSDAKLSDNIQLSVMGSNKSQAKCYVDASSRVDGDIRNYLTIFDTVCIAPPLENYMDPVMHDLGVTEDELTALFETGRVQFVFPYSIDRYKSSWLNKVASVGFDGILLSRKLAALKVIDARKRLPFLFPALNAEDRHVALNSVYRLCLNLPDNQMKWAIKYVRELCKIWTGYDYMLQRRGAFGMMSFGVGAIASTFIESVSGKDLRFEMWTAADKVETAAALNASVFAEKIGGYDDSRACDIVAGIYSSRSSIMPRNAYKVIGELLAIDKSVPVIAFSKEFYSSDIVRLRTLIKRLACEYIDDEELNSKMEKFNSEVRQYERRPEMLKSISIAGLVASSLTAFDIVSDERAKLVPLIGNILSIAISMIINDLPRSSAPIGKFIDSLNGYLAGINNPEAVLVARKKKELKIMRR